MSALSTLFDFKGRINRSQFWLLLIALTASTAAIILLPSLLIHLVSMSTSYAFHKYVYGTYYVCSVLIAASYIVSALSIMARRLHDLGFSAWWLVIFLLPIVLPAPADDFMRGGRISFSARGSSRRSRRSRFSACLSFSGFSREIRHFLRQTFYDQLFTAQ